MPRDELEIVASSPRFEAEVIDLVLSIQRDEFGIQITAEQQPDLRTIPSVYQTGCGSFWVALSQGRVVGTTPFFHAAHRFYEKNGFSELPEAELPASFPIMEVDTRFYRLAMPTRAATCRSAEPMR